MRIAVVPLARRRCRDHGAARSRQGTGVRERSCNRIPRCSTRRRDAQLGRAGSPDSSLSNASRDDRRATTASLAIAAILSLSMSLLASCAAPPREPIVSQPPSTAARPPAASIAPSLARFEYVRMAMGGAARIVLFAPDEDAARRAAIEAFDEIEAVEQALSDWRDASEVRIVERRLQEHPGETVAVSATLAACLARSLEVSQASDGAFDVTIAPVVEQWRVAARAGGLPPSDARRAALTSWAGSGCSWCKATHRRSPRRPARASTSAASARASAPTGRSRCFDSTDSIARSSNSVATSRSDRRRQTPGAGPSRSEPVSATSGS